MATFSLSQRWDNLCKAMPLHEQAYALGEDLLTRYREPQRFYHDISHLEAVLSMLDQSKEMLEASGEINNISEAEKIELFQTIELALWYHDAVYDPQKKDNEEQNAKLFIEHAKKMGLSQKQTDDIENLILLTADHHKAIALDEKIIVDCDIAVLGADETIFKKYDENIRNEYSFVPLETYTMLRREVLQNFLKQKPIFKTKAFQGIFGAQAEKNLKQATSVPNKKNIPPKFGLQ